MNQLSVTINGNIQPTLTYASNVTSNIDKFMALIRNNIQLDRFGFPLAAPTATSITL
jgi:uncharacterized protein YabE (DUF348 family)